jgi:GNAT superfamily N-acetyltransferase
VRFILTEPGAAAVVGELAASVPAGIRVTVEDPWGTHDQHDQHGLERLRMPLMVRPPGPIEVPDRPGIRIARVSDADELAEAERVMVDGFPLRGFQPLTTGAALPARLLDTPGWDVWLAVRDGQSAAAGYTYVDGRAVGVYWLATLPGHRSAGLGRALLANALSATHSAAHSARPGLPATLVATEAGRPLYESLGFTTVSTAVWYIRN